MRHQELACISTKVPKSWLQRLKMLAWTRSVETQRMVSYGSLVRDAIRNAYPDVAGKSIKTSFGEELKNKAAPRT